MQLHEQIVTEVQTDKDEINRLKHGEIKIIVQDGNAIRTEIMRKKKIDAQRKG